MDGCSLLGADSGTGMKMKIPEIFSDEDTCRIEPFSSYIEV